MNWYAIYTKPRSEDAAASLLTKAGIETLNPKLKINKYLRRKYIDVTEHLFPTYIFALFDYDKQGNMVRYTRGIKYIIGRQNPIIVHPEIIMGIKERMKDDIIMPLSENLKTGDRVRIKEGPFADFYGIFEKNMPKKQRVTIFLETLFCRVDIKNRSIQKA